MNICSLRKRRHNVGSHPTLLAVVFCLAIATWLLTAPMSYADSPSAPMAAEQKLPSVRVEPLIKTSLPTAANNAPETLKSKTTAPSHSANWAGYYASNDTFTQASGNIKVPSVTCTKAEAATTNYTLFWVGFGGVSSGNVEQDGIAVSCVSLQGGGSAPVYAAWWAMPPYDYIQWMTPSLAMSPGDLIGMKVEYANGVYTMTVANKTTRQTVTTSQQCAAGATCDRSSGDWIAERATSANGNLDLLIRWYNFGFSEVVATGGTGKSQSIGVYLNTPVDMINPADNGKLLAQVPPQLDATNQAFPDKWSASE